MSPAQKKPARTPAATNAATKTPAAERGRFKSLRVSDGFRDFVLEQLAGVRDVHARAMFGGVGLYAGDAFFGILAADVLYLKVDDSRRADVEAAGSEPFKPFVNRPMSMNYYSVPPAVLEDAAKLCTWARGALRAARSSKSTRTSRVATAARSARTRRR